MVDQFISVMKNFTSFSGRKILLLLISAFLFITGKAQPTVGNGSSVTFTNVNAVVQDTSAFVQWTVDGQNGITSYAIEKSVDGLNFTKIGEIPASALQTTYNWTDDNMAAPSIYYRIASIGNKVEYSKDVEVSYGNNTNGGVPDITAFPNPIAVDQAIHLQTINIPDGVYTVSLVNMSGQRIWIKDMDHTIGNTVETITPGYQIVRGMYFMTITGHDRYKFIIKVVFI
jgi:hypothetical protein